MTIYRGRRTENGTVVTADDTPLDPRLDIRDLARVFEWGYVGSGPYQLAIALLAHHRGDEFALQHYKDLAETLITDLREDRWSVDGADLDRAIENATPVPMDLQELLRRVRGGGPT